ncbi:MAG: hypothetical protein ACKVX9_00840 [Blastocatellia bacterium]
MTVEAPRIEDIARTENDPALHPYLAAIGEEHAARALSELIDRSIDPRVRGIVEYKLRFSAGRFDERDETPDLQHEILLQLIARLAELRAAPDRSPIRNLSAYVAVAAYRACHDYLRRKYPARHSLKQRLRYALAHRAELACWEAEAEQWMCGLAEWRDDPSREPMSEGRARQVLAHASIHRSESLEELSIALLSELQQPVELDVMVGIVAELQGVRDYSAADNSYPEEMPESRADPRESIVDDLARRAWLGAIWREIERMTPKHRAALLLNLRDGQGGGAIELLLFTGVASFAEIAAAMEMTEAELAAIWNRLPLDDATIAGRLGISRQQVINLRGTARNRLVRRMKSPDA